MFKAIMQYVAIVTLTVLACISYGIIHDQVTARICVEYFTIGHAQVLRIPIVDPTILAFIWGVIATWWVGLLLGVPLSLAAQAGPLPQRSALSLIQPIVVLCACNFAFALVSGFAGYIGASSGWISLTSPISELVPVDKHIPFIVDLWAHNASYIGGFLGGVVLIVHTRRSRFAAVTDAHSPVTN